MNPALVKEIQRLLIRHGYRPGPVDGIFGPRTSRAVIDFKRARGLRARDYVGPITLGELRKPAEEVLVIPPDKAPAKKKGEPIWLRRARQELGVREIAGSYHSARVLSYWELAKLSFTDDETPWCAGFVCAMLEDCGIKSPRSGLARSFNGWARSLDKPRPGAVVVFWRGSRNGYSGHVGFVVGKDQSGNLMVLGGNQGNEVNIKPFSTGRVLSYRWPIGYDLGGAKLDLVTSDGRLSTNEA